MDRQKVSWRDLNKAQPIDYQKTVDQKSEVMENPLAISMVSMEEGRERHGLKYWIEW